MPVQVLTLCVTVELLLQPKALVPETVYVVVTVGDIVMVGRLTPVFQV